MTKTMRHQHRHLTAAGIACALTTSLLIGSADAGAYATGAATAAQTTGIPSSAPDGAAAPASCSALDLALMGFPEYRKFRDSRRLRTPVILHGTLTDTTGAPIRSAVVLLAATSRDMTTMVPLAVNRTDREGRYVLRAAMTRKVRALYERPGVDLHMEWFTPGHRHLVWGTNVGWDQKRRAWIGLKLDNPDHRGPGTRDATPRNQEDISFDPRGGDDVSGWCAYTGHARHQVPAAG